MCDPVWIYGVPVTQESLCEYARKKAPDCVCDDDDETTAFVVVDHFAEHFRRRLLAGVGIDVFDKELKHQLVLILHEDYPGESQYTQEDEDYIRSELGIKEKGKWFRYFVSFFSEDVDEYKKSIPGPIPSNERSVDAGSALNTTTSSNITHLSQSVAAVRV